VYLSRSPKDRIKNLSNTGFVILVTLAYKGVGKSINLMNKSFIPMKNYLKTIASTMVMFALVLSAFLAPLSSATAFTVSSNSSTNEFTIGSSSSSVTSCNIDANRYTVTQGESVTVNWNTSGFTNITINGESVSGNSGSKTYTNMQVRTVFRLEATNSSGSTCVQQVIVNCIPPGVPTFCELGVTKTVDKSSAKIGDTLTYTITVKNNGDADCTGDGVKIEDVLDPNLKYVSNQVTSNVTAGYKGLPVYTSSDRTLRFNGNVLSPNEGSIISIVTEVTAPAQCGDFKVRNQAKATAKELNDFGTWKYSPNVVTDIDNDCVVVVPVPTCDSFTASPSTITLGGKSTLTWATTNATQVTINNGVGSRAVDGTVEVSPIADTIYKLTAISVDNKNVYCEVPVKVSARPVPVCEIFTAAPNQFSFGGGTTNLNWKVIDATEVTIDNNIGSVGPTGNRSTNVTKSTTFKLTAKNASGDEVSCFAPVTVSNPDAPFTCSDNVNFAASDRSITRGDDITLNWSTSDVDTVSISVINQTSLSGSRTVSPSSDTTYVLTATQGNKTINCPVSVNVSTGGGGGGGGSSSPRCDLDISDTKIKRGEEITIKWNTSNATEITLKDDRGKTVFTTDDLLSRDKKEYLDGSVKLRPTRDTEYILIAERGSRDRECKVKVDVQDSVVVLQTRDQQPLVAGISLSQVPYTGFEAGPVMTIMFYLLLVAWALYVTYLLVIRKKMATVKSNPVMESPSVNMENQAFMQTAEAKRPDVFVASVTSALSTHEVSPANLPTGTPTIGYDNHVEDEVNPHQVSDTVVTDLENRAHSQKALLSSDAVRYFIGTTEGLVERNEALDQVIVEAKKTYPLEDGWIVINEARMQNLCKFCKTGVSKNTPSYSPVTVPEGSSSLAEAIVTGNVVAAYEMIGNRPMFALADAAADLDALYRHRKGGEAKVSNLLVSETEGLSEEKIKNMISALTGAIDGTYTDEASAVKMAIMKAVKEAA